MNGGIRAGDLLVIGGKPGQGKTIAALQWARHMAQTGHTAIFACYEHDEITLLTRLLACELGEAIAASETTDEIRLDRLRDGLRAVSHRDGLGTRGARLRPAAARRRSTASRPTPTALILVGRRAHAPTWPALGRLVERAPR